MDLDRVDPSLREATRTMTVPDLSRPLVRRLVATASGLLRVREVPGVRSRTERVGSLRVRVYVPDAPSGAGLLWIHGGGFVIGSWRQDHRHCAETARETGAVVVSADYGLAPRHPFPAPLDDVRRCWEWLRAEAPALGVEADRLAVGGASAGAGLAATLVQRLYDEGARPVAQWLFAPMLDDRTAADRSLDAVDNRVWNNALNRVGWSAYLGAEPGSAVAEYAAAARREDLSGLPPTWIGVGDIDLFHDEDAEYARRLAEAGVPTTFEVVPGAPHGFEIWAIDSEPARAYLGRARAWLAEHLG
jgi:acetyl esterase/lipase